MSAATTTATDVYADGGAGPELDFVGPGVHTAMERLDGTFGLTGSGTSQAAAITSGIFALLRAQFPDEPVARLVQRALYNTHNGLGTQNLGTRVDDRYGYGASCPTSRSPRTIAHEQAEPDLRGAEAVRAGAPGQQRARRRAATGRLAATSGPRRVGSDLGPPAAATTPGRPARRPP